MFNNLPKNWKLKVDSQSKGFAARLMSSYGLKKSEWEDFINIDFEKGFLDPWQLPDMKKAVKRLVEAKDKNEKILIYGDYDADGIPGVALLLKGLTHAGFKNIDAIIPTREEGYGINIEKIKININNYQLLITVDTGVTAKDEIKYIKNQGVDIIVTDHHEVIDDIPKDALAVIDPKRKDSKYGFCDLSGTAVAFKLLWALYEEMKLDNTYLKWNIDLVAVATVADLMPLVGENRVLTHFGIQVLRKSKNSGLASLMKLANLEQSKLNTYSIAFGIAPRINAPSRLQKERVDSSTMQSENIALTMLISDDYSQAFESAAIVNQLNSVRKQIVANEAEQIMKETKVPKGGAAFVIQNVPVGVIGLIASYLSQNSGWPCLVMTPVGEDLRGSGRSPTDLSLLSLIEKHSKLLVKFGGHKQAAGWTVSQNNVGQFCRLINKDLQQQTEKYPKKNYLNINTVLFDHEGSLENAKFLSQLEPFGVDNEKPLFLVETIIDSVVYMGQERNHIKIFSSDNYPEMVWFNADLSLRLAVGEKIIAAVYLEVNNFRGEIAQLNIQDLVKVNEKNKD